MIEAAWALAGGAAAGAVHVLAGPDHLAAVAPLGADEGRPSPWRLGAAWGGGHALGVVLLGVLAVVARRWLDPAWASAWGERLVGMTLVAVGLWGATRAARRWTHSHPHRHGEEAHAHPHLHLPGRGNHFHSHASFAIGTLHGIAGGSHLLGVLPALALPSTGVAAAYLGGFAAGTVGAMVAFAAAVSRLAGGFGPRRPRAAAAVLGGLSTLAIGVGVAWILAP